MTIEERLSVIKKKLIDLAARKQRTIIESLSEEDTEDDKAKMIRDNIEKKIRNKSAKEFLSSCKRHKQLISGLSRSTNASYWVGCNLSTNNIGITKETPEEINDRRIAQLAKWKLCEVFKVTINFLQAIAVAAVINVEWTQYMLTLFDMSAFAGGTSTALVTRAIHCFPWWNGTGHATYIGLVSGLLIPIFVVLCIVASFAFITYKSSKGMYYFVKRSVLATLAISYFSYLSITRVAIMFFYCVGVRTNENHFSTEETYYWALDTSIQCSASAHKKLMVFGGILFGLFSVGSPLISAAILVLFRKPTGQRDPRWMSDILGFLYRGYKRKFVYWESTVMLRKALLSVIAVFSYHLGGHSQGLLASSILTVCLFFQAICKPYRYEFETVNNHESLSLLISGITFTLAQFFMKDRTNDTAKVALTVFLMIAIVGFLLYMIVSMLICLLDVIKTDLIVRGELADDNDDEDENSWSFLGTWVASRLVFSRRPSNDNDLEMCFAINKTVVTDDDEDDDVAGCSSHVGAGLNLLIEEHAPRNAPNGSQNQQIYPDGGRMLRQNESDCDCNTLRQDLYDESRRTWFMNIYTSSAGNNHIQCVVDCAEDSDTIILSTEYTIQPESTITINKSITISGFHDQEVDTFNDTYPTEQNKAVITCPDNATQGIFNITSGGVTIANLKIRDCLNPENAAPVVIGKCKDSNEGGLQIHHVDFVNNSGSSHPVAINVLSPSSTCGVLKMTDVSFRDNVAGDNTAFVKLRSTAVMRNIRVRNNQRINDTAQGVKLVQFTTTEKQNDSLTIDNLVAIGNSIPILEAKSGVVSISNSIIRDNKIQTVNDGNNQDSNMIQFSSVSKAIIKNCLFSDNIGGGGAIILSDNVSSLDIVRSTFNQNFNIGSVVFSTQSVLNILNCNMSSNCGNLNGGVFHLKSSGVRITDSTFSDNMSDENGGVVYAVESSHFTVRRSTFVNNTAREGGCFYIKASDVRLEKSTFQRNKARTDGGAIRLERGGVRCRNSTFEYSTALDEGGAFKLQSATYIKWKGIIFRSNEGAYGSAVRLINCKKQVTWRDVVFRDATAGLTGAAACIDNSNLIIIGALFENHKASYGGAIYAQAFNMTIKNALFKNNNAHVMGGAISGDNGTITFENTSFIENSSTLGGALHVYNATFIASEISFLHNKASEGAGLLCKESTVSIGPFTNAKGKIPSSRVVTQLNSLFGIYAFNNTGLDSGGVIASKVSNVIISYGAFVDNSAPEGGAIQVTSDKETSVNIAHSILEGNMADVRGGSIAARATDGDLFVNLSSVQFKKCISNEGGAIFFTSVNALVENCIFDSNAANDGGAAFIQKSRTVLSNEETFKDRSITPDIRVAVRNCCFIGNKANTRGGAIMLRGELLVDRQFMTSGNGGKGLRYAEDGFNVEIESVNFSNNRAYTEGGAIHGKATNLIMHNATVMNNNATEGGGACLVQTVFSIFDSKIIGNQAENGAGGIKATRKSNGIIFSTTISSNKVTKHGEGGGLRISGCTVKGQDLYIASNSATLGGGVSLALVTERDSIVEQQDADSRFLCLSCMFTNNEAFTSGGGVNIQHQNSNIVVVAKLENCTFEDNSADVFGGGIHFGKPVGHLDNISKAPCGYLVILNSSFMRNTAGRSGGSLISYDRYKVLAQCSAQTTNTQLFDFLNTTEVQRLRSNNRGYCPQWNEGVNAKIVPAFASYVNRCQANIESKVNWSRINDNSLEISGTVPGERLPDIMMKCYDEFENIAKSDRKSFTATLKSREEGYLEGIFVTDLADGSGNFTGVRNPSNGDTFWKNYTYELKISFSLDYVLPITIQINVRECRINEEKESEGVLCRKCDATQYNFNPMNETCKPCDGTLDCSGTFVRLSENYWHASPCHAHAQKCLTTNACRGPAYIDKKLTTSEYININLTLKEYSCQISAKARDEYRKLLCKEGYEGVLCGSCKADYGRSLSFACTKCNSPGVSVLILGFLCIWLALIAGITIRGSMTIEERLSVIKKKLIDLAARNSLAVTESLSEEDTEDDKAKMIRDNIEKKVKKKSAKLLYPSSKHHKRMISGLSRSTNASSYWIGCSLLRKSIGITKETPEEINDRRIAQLAKWKLCEVFKVTINFLQAIAVAAVINVEWTQYMLTLFDMSVFAGGASTALVTRAIHCFPWWNGTRYATYIGLVSGLLIPVFVVLCIVATFAFITYKSSKGMYYFVKRSVLATLAIFYFSYLSITRVAVIFFYCVGVRTNENHFSTEKSYYWALDTSIQCSASYHKRLMVFGGILFGLFSVGFPLISAAILVRFRKPFGQKDPQWMSDILGFLYRGYKRKFVYWESTVMLRKALLSVIAVFSYHLGGHSQGLLASSILSVCLFFQAICKPYRHEFENVNKHESLSLLVSGITFTLAQFFMKDRTNDAVKVSLTVFLMIAIVGFLLYMIVSLLICLLEVMKTNLKVIGALADDNGSSWSVLSTWVALKLGFSKRPKDNDLEMCFTINNTVMTDDYDDDDVAGCSWHVSRHSFLVYQDDTF
eukprot:g7134.t1